METLANELIHGECTVQNTIGMETLGREREKKKKEKIIYNVK
jgi:hypothetical protein